jgi:iron complex outermembrane recepter protein
MKNGYLRLVVRASLIWILFGLVSSVSAQETEEERQEESFIIEEVEVTAEKRTENIQDVAAAVSAIDAAEIEDAGIDETQDVADFVPNMATYRFSEGFSYYSLRGQTNFNSYSQSVGIYVDDVPVNSNCNFSDVNLWNIEQIEVLRGPAGNLYGLNSTGGVINIKTQQPDDYVTAGAKVRYGNYNAATVGGYVSGPIIEDTLYLGLSGDFRRADSFIEEKQNQDRSYYMGHLRGQVHYRPCDRLDLTLTVDGGKDYSDYISWTLDDDDPFDIPYHNHDEYSESITYNESLKAVYTLDGLEITSISALSQGDMEGEMEQAYNGTYYMDWGMDNNRFLEELRIASNNENCPLTWLVGAFYQNNEIGYDYKWVYNNADNKGDEVTIAQQTYSIFAQLGYTFFDKLTVTPGIRYDYDKKEFDDDVFNVSTGIDEGASDSADWSAVSPRLAVNYKVNDDVMIYTSIARAYKAGGYAVNGGSTDVDSEEFDPESSISCELGTKTTWFEKKLLLNMAAFYTLIDDMQSFYLVPSTQTYDYNNIGEAAIYGLEAEIGIRPIRELEIGLPLGWMYSELTKNADSDYKGNRAPLVPEYTAGLTAQYNHSSGFFVWGEANFLGKTYFDEANDYSQDAFMVLNSRIGYKTGYITVAGYVNNLIDEEYYTYLVDAGSPDAWARVGAPRTLGIEVSMQY